ncbi:hypothetical protein L9F63_021685, partial [Diploptera punctata]
CPCPGIMELLGIRFAPLNTPLDRRLQTLAACCWFITLGFGPTLSIVFTIYVVLFTQWYLLALAYLAWIWYDRDVCNKGGR